MDSAKLSSFRDLIKSKYPDALSWTICPLITNDLGDPKLPAVWKRNSLSLANTLESRLASPTGEPVYPEPGMRYINRIEPELIYDWRYWVDTVLPRAASVQIAACRIHNPKCYVKAGLWLPSGVNNPLTTKHRHVLVDLPQVKHPSAFGLTNDWMDVVGISRDRKFLLTEGHHSHNSASVFGRLSINLLKIPYCEEILAHTEALETLSKDSVVPCRTTNPCVWWPARTGLYLRVFFTDGKLSDYQVV